MPTCRARGTDLASLQNQEKESVIDGLGLLRATFEAELCGLFERRAKPIARRPIVLLHGFAGWSRGLLPLEYFLRRRLSREVIRLRLGTGLAGVEAAAERAAQAIANVVAVHGAERVDVVGHSMGGLVATRLLKTLEVGGRLGTVITLGTPHRGTPFALAGARVLGRLGLSLAQMVPGCRFLADLERRPVPEGSALYSLAGLADLVVPAPCARLPRRARHHNRSLEAVDHWDLVYAGEAQRAIARLLRDRADASPIKEEAACSSSATPCPVKSTARASWWSTPDVPRRPASALR